MRTLLIFIGSLLYPAVMFIISPLLVLVYSGLYTARLYAVLKTQQPVFAKAMRNFTHLHFHNPTKKHVQALWSRAVRFHL